MPTRYERILSVTLCALLGVWLGGLGALILFVIALFKADRALATQAAPVMFERFALVQIGIALVVTVIAGGMSWKRWLGGVVWVLTAVALLCSVSVYEVTAWMNLLRQTAEGAGALFVRYHGYANILYLAIFVLVLATLITTLWRLSAGASRGTGLAAAAA